MKTSLPLFLSLALLNSGGQGGLQAVETTQKPSAAPRAKSARTNPAPAQVITIPEGSDFRVRLDDTVDTRRNRPGDKFNAVLLKPVEVDGVAAIPGGTRFTGHLVDAKPSGRVRGRAVLSLRLDSFELNGRTYRVMTSRVIRSSGNHKKGNWIAIGGGAGTGAAFGAIAGPGGALIGAGAGAAAGYTVRALTGQKNVRVPAETILSFTLRAPAAVAE